MLIPTDEPEVTEDTRFWLFFEASWSKAKYADESYRTIVGWERWSQRINVEVSEQTYRAAQAEAYGHTADDVTLPLDDHWWGELTSIEAGTTYHPNIRHTRGGYIDWWG